MVRETQVKSLILASPEFPSGQAWLANALLACQIRVQPIRTPDYWEALPNQKFRIRDRNEEKQRSRWFPILYDHKEFNFREPVVVEWTHEFPPRNLNSPYLYMHRNGKDALYSDYRRLNTKISFLEYLRSPYPIERGSLAFVPGLPPAETWALHTLLWLKEPNGHVVSFEKTKSEPESVLRAVLKFMGIERTETEIRTAVRLSSFEYAKAKETDFLKTNPQGNVTAVFRGGKSGEWKDVYQEAETKCFEGLPQLALARLGYDSSLPNPSSVPATEMASRVWGMEPLQSELRYLAPHALVLTAIAQTLNPKTDRKTISQLLECATREDLFFEERKAIALNFLRMGHRRKAVKAILPYVDCTLAKPKVETLARELSRHSAFGLASRILIRTRFSGGLRLLFQELRLELRRSFSA